MKKLLTSIASLYLLAGCLTFAQGAYLPPSGLKQGDIILVSLNCYACKLIQETAHSPYSHVAILFEDPVTHVLGAIMAVPPKVMEIQGLSYFYDNSLVPPLVLRMKTEDGQKLASSAAESAKKYIGIPYDSDFVNGPKEMYCSSLISYSFKEATGGATDPFPFVPMDFEQFKNEWAAILGHPAPQGFPGISPGDIARSALLAPFLGLVRN